MEADIDPGIKIIPVELASAWGGADGLIAAVVRDDEIVAEIPLSRMIAHTNPLQNPPWRGGRGVTVDGILRALAEERLERTSYSNVESNGDKAEWDDARHEARIAYLIRHKASEPLEIEFPYPTGEDFDINDGHHRLAASIWRNDQTITVSLGGFIENAIPALGVICREYYQVETELMAPAI
jgi:hypothetical protein